MFADVTSANVVGYANMAQNPDEEDFQNPTFGFTFQPLNDEEGWVSLGNVAVDGLDPFNNGDYFYQLLPEDATPGAEVYYYFDLANVKLWLEADGVEYTEEEAKALVGWWSDFAGYAEDDPSEFRLDDVSFKAGSSFVGLILGCQNLIVKCNGEAQRTKTNVNVSQQLNPTFANPIPRDIALGEVKVAGLDAFNGDFFFQLLKTDATPGADVFYYFDLENVKLWLEADGVEYTEEEAKALVGWWSDFAGYAEDDPSEYRLDGKIVKPGEAFIGLLYAGSQELERTTVVSFPEAVVPPAAD